MSFLLTWLCDLLGGEVASFPCRTARDIQEAGWVKIETIFPSLADVAILAHQSMQHMQEAM